MAKATKSEVRVRLLAKAAELAAAHETLVEVKEKTARAIINEIAKANPLLGDQIVRGDGTPRSSTKILIDGKPPLDLDKPVPEGADVVIAIAMPCDG